MRITKLHHQRSSLPLFQHRIIFFAEKFFGQDVNYSAKKPQGNESGRWTKKHDYWQEMKARNFMKKDKPAEYLDEIKNSARWKEALDAIKPTPDGHAFQAGDTLSGILRGTFKLQGKALLLALTHLKTDKGMDIDNVPGIAGKTIYVEKAENRFQMKIGDDGASVDLFPDFVYEKKEPLKEEPKQEQLPPEVEASLTAKLSDAAEAAKIKEKTPLKNPNVIYESGDMRMRIQCMDRDNNAYLLILSNISIDPNLSEAQLQQIMKRINGVK